MAETRLSLYRGQCMGILYRALHASGQGTGTVNYRQTKARAHENMVALQAALTSEEAMVRSYVYLPISPIILTRIASQQKSLFLSTLGIQAEFLFSEIFLKNADTSIPRAMEKLGDTWAKTLKKHTDIDLDYLFPEEMQDLESTLIRENMPTLRDQLGRHDLPCLRIIPHPETFYAFLFVLVRA